MAVSPVFSEDVAEMTDLEILMELQANLEAREKSLNERETLLNEREQLLNEREKSLTAIESLSRSLREESRKEAAARYWAAFGRGAAVGLALGFTGGVCVGGTISF